MPLRHLVAGLAIALLLTGLACAQSVHAARDGTDLRPNLAGQIARPLRYRPDGGDFVIVNGTERFNRPLYGGASAFRVDAGDCPEFSLYLPGRGGVLRLALVRDGQAKWLSDAAQITARYRAGTMVYEIRDAALGDGTLTLTALAPKSAEALLLRLELRDAPRAELATIYGGLTGERARRDGDLGTEPQPIRDYFRFQPEHCRDNKVTLGDAAFTVVHAKLAVAALFPGNADVAVADASRDDLAALLVPVERAIALPVGAARFLLEENRPAHLALLRATGIDNAAPLAHDALPVLFAREQAALLALSRRVTIETPDPFLDAALPALNIAADAVWDDRPNAFLHGAVAWRTRLLGWRVGYAGDALGWPERTRAHFDGFAAQQNTSPVPAALPAPEAPANLARNETALHSNGDLTNSHYDMNVVALDTIFRHLRWTGDLAYARKIWPVIERSLAWERRLFRREFGPDKLPLYEAYAAIWASDDLTYSGGGATHATALNLLHHREAARLARLLRVDPTPYETEATLIERGLQQHLWLAREGWFAESRDWLGLQRTHPSAAAWTVYHALDSQACTPLQAWQLARYADTALPRFPLTGRGVPPGAHTIATTNWMPYTWSLNNVVFAESTHTALALWQAGRTDAANRLFRGALLDSMFLGACPGNAGMTTALDVYRREAQRDFGDGIGAASRAIVEGLFGVTPDLLASEIVVRPGFPADWDRARLRHPRFDFFFERRGNTDRYTFVAQFAKPIALRFQVPARAANARVTLDGQPAAWRALPESVGEPRIEVLAPRADRFTVEIEWRGAPPPAPPADRALARDAELACDFGARIVEFADPQTALADVTISGSTLRGRAAGLAGARTAFARLEHGALRWWQPIEFEIRERDTVAPLVFTTDWRTPIAAPEKCEPLALAPLFNDRVAQLFRHDYLAPRSPFAALALARNGYGTWTHPNATFDIDDSGLRAVAAAHSDRLVLPNGVPLATPGAADAPNIAFVSQWQNFPRELTAPLSGRARKIFLLLAGSTWAMQSRLDNGEIVIAYRDGTATRVPLENPTTWWPIDQDYFVDDFAFARSGALPLRVDLKTGAVRVLDADSFKGRGRAAPGGAATVLDLALDPERELASLTIRALANDVVIGLMSATLERP
ncbi:MAG: DUF4450 domain-containing protein [Opitutae bacterium]|nr:DUF4450 domain-containing protein [Opitutae bacterium]